MKMSRKNKNTGRRLKAALPILSCLLALAAWLGCAPIEPEGESSGVGVQLAPILASCDPNGVQFNNLGTFQVEATVTGADSSGEPILLGSASGQINTSGSGLEISGIAEGSGRVVTIKGTLADGSAMYSRARNVSVFPKQDTLLEMLLVPAGSFGCLEVPQDFGNILFPATVTLPDGRVVIAGGYQAVTDQAGTTVLTGASDKVFVFDGRRGTFQRVPDLMSSPRGAAGAAYLPGQRKVVIFGGARELRFDKAGDDFPFSFINTDAIRSYEVLSVDAMDVRLGNPQATDPIFLEIPTESTAGNPPNQMLKARVFPRHIVLDQDDAVLVTGGGQWPEDVDSGYLEAEYFHPKAFSGVGGFVDPKGGLVTNSIRAGHSMIVLGYSSTGMTRALLWGGTNDTGAAAEVFLQGSATGPTIDGVFVPVVLRGDAVPTYFHSAARLGTDRVLVVGGVNPDGANLSAGGDAGAYILDYSTDGNFHYIDVTQVPGLDGARYFSALGVTGDGGVATVLGGWTGSDGSPSTSILTAVLDPTAVGQNAKGDCDDENPCSGTRTCIDGACYDGMANGQAYRSFFSDGSFDGLGGMGAQVLPNDAMLIVGGLLDPSVIDSLSFGVAETFVSATISK